MSVNMKFIGALRHLSGKTQAKIKLQKNQTVKDLILKISESAPELKKSLITQQDDPKPNALILVNGREISVLSGLNTLLQDGDDVVFIPVVHGG
jgi:sulfur-carrier protein